MAETKAEILARISELQKVSEEFWSSLTAPSVEQTIERRLEELRGLLDGAEDDIFKSVIRSHEAICEVKKMHPKAAYGQDPALYYSLAVCGEAGEMGNKIVKALRNGNDPEATRRAVISELPDVVIYGAVLAHVLDIDLAKLVNEKVGVVIERALSGHYGGPLSEAEADKSSP